jgi:glucose-1-phosphate thymidylyltransferase
MKGVVLCGGLGTRLSPLTRITNKHLLPVYDKPMIFYPIDVLVRSGIKEIVIVTGEEHAGRFLNLLRNGQDFGLDHLSYAYQEGSGGIADAIKYVEPFIQDDSFAVILGDCIYEHEFRSCIEAFEADKEMEAAVHLMHVDNPKEFGVIEMKDGEPFRIVEKPENPPTDVAVTGLYFYRRSVFDVIKTLRPSGRGELEVTDINNYFISKEKMMFFALYGYWLDCGGSIDSLYRASEVIRNAKKQEGK